METFITHVLCSVLLVHRFHLHFHKGSPLHNFAAASALLLLLLLLLLTGEE
jgi:hypothetical protein